MTTNLKMRTSYCAATSLGSGITALHFNFYTFCPFASLLSANANGFCLFYKDIYADLDFIY